MLQHVHGQRGIVKSVQRRPDREPHENDSTEKRWEPPARNEIGECRAQAKPASRINKGGKAQRQIKSEGIGPRLQDRVRVSIHSFSQKFYGWPEPGPAASGARAMARAASRAGACPAGCSDSRNATSAVVSAGLKFLP